MLMYIKNYKYNLLQKASNPIWRPKMWKLHCSKRHIVFVFVWGIIRLRRQRSAKPCSDNMKIQVHIGSELFIIEGKGWAAMRFLDLILPLVIIPAGASGLMGLLAFQPFFCLQ